MGTIEYSWIIDLYAPEGVFFFESRDSQMKYVDTQSDLYKQLVTMYRARLPKAVNRDSVSKSGQIEEDESLSIKLKKVENQSMSNMSPHLAQYIST